MYIHTYIHTHTNTHIHTLIHTYIWTIMSNIYAIKGYVRSDESKIPYIVFAKFTGALICIPTCDFVLEFR